MLPDIYISVRFKTEKEGGRSTNVIGMYYSCPLVVDENAFECRLLLDGAELELGRVYEVPVKLMNKSEALQKLHVGKEIVLWEGKNIGDGTVMRIL